MVNDTASLVVATVHTDENQKPHVFLHWQKAWRDMDIESRGRTLLQLINAIEDTVVDSITDIQAARRELQKLANKGK